MIFGLLNYRDIWSQRGNPLKSDSKGKQDKSKYFDMPPKKPALDFKASGKTPSGYGVQVSLKIMDGRTAVGAIVGGIACGAAAVVCGVMYWIQTNPELVKAAVKAALEAVGVEVKNVAPGSILVEVLCTSKESFLLFMDDFETNKIKQRLEKEFQKKLDFKGELEVKIINEQEVYADLDHLR